MRKYITKGDIIMKKYFTIREKSTNNFVGLLGQYDFNENNKVIQDTENFTVQKISYKKFIDSYKCFLMYFDLEFYNIELHYFEILNTYNSVITTEINKIHQYEKELKELLYKNSKMHNEK